MPVISITLLPGYSAEAEERLVGRVALAARSVIAAAAAGTTVFVNHAHTYQRDGRVFSKGGPECANASELVRHFLALTQERDLKAARGHADRLPRLAPLHLARLRQPRGYFPHHEGA